MRTTESKICPQCHKEFTPLNKFFNITKYCSAYCRFMAFKKRKSTFAPRSIPCNAFRCKNEFVAKSPEQKYCSRECNAVSKHGAFKCLCCGCWFMNKSYRLPSDYCSPECGLKGHSNNHNNNNWPKLYL